MRLRLNESRDQFPKGRALADPAFFVPIHPLRQTCRTEKPQPKGQGREAGLFWFNWRGSLGPLHQVAELRA